ncbi:MAG: hypothetical protein PWR01_3972 [Clostridiales bacterium]|nr:hypothetical protein [Clostridiales bacterium]MDN5282899.1 hypothetical protein [Candidatus Ozemobacter sp.]
MSSGILKANELSEIKEVLASDQASTMIERDVYWPKWDTPWWYFLLLEETDRLEEVPVETFKELLMCADRQFLHSFPISEDELPENLNPYTEIVCFCFLGSLMRLASKVDFDAFAWLPWAKDWIHRYQLPDGGYNCDEAAYSGSGKGSLISTTVMLEGMLAYVKFSGNYDEFGKNIEKAVSYLLKHHIYLSTKAAEIDGTEWDKIIFPRFYEYDFSRGLEAVLDFVLQTGKKVRRSNMEKAISLLEKKLSEGLNHSEKQWLSEEKTISYYIEAPVLFKDMANVPLVMKKLNSTAENPFVVAKLNAIKEKLNQAQSNGQLV